MKRREAIKRTALLMGYAVSASAIAGVMGGCQADTKTPEAIWKPKAFSDVQIKTLQEAAERIVPATEGIVGAKDVKVDRFIDELAAGFYKPEEVARFKTGLDKLEADAMQAHAKSFANLDATIQDDMLTKLMNKAKGAKEDDHPFFFDLKGATLLGYFTSEEVGENVLNYDPVPGGYNGCMPMEDVPNGRTWSL